MKAFDWSINVYNIRKITIGSDLKIIGHNIRNFSILFLLVIIYY